MSFIEQYLLQLNTEKRRWRCAVAILTALSLLVALATVWNLRMTGVTIANSATCGYEEHLHTSECVAETTLICGYNLQENSTEESSFDVSQETDAITQETDDVSSETPSDESQETIEVSEETREESVHTHTDDCYLTVYSCNMEEHIHKISCYSDPSADVETAEIWEATLPDDLGEYWSENLARIAISQIGAAESEKNFILADDGETKLGITRYGQWYGNPYGDWSAMFTAFCLNYANVPTEAIPRSSGVYSMMQLCNDKKILSQPDEYVGVNGNILFLDTDGNGNADRILIVTALQEPATAEGSENTIIAVGGDWDNAVTEVQIAKDDPKIVGYVPTAAVRDAYLQSLPLYSINKNNNVYNIDVYALAVDYDGNRITEVPVENLGTLRINSTSKTSVSSKFDYDLGVYHSAYFGTEESVSVDNVNTVWRYKSGSTYYLAYSQTNGYQNQRWKSRADTTISLYLRYTPEFTVSFESEGFETVMEYVGYKDYPTLTEPSEWIRDGYSLVGWLASDNQTVYSYDELMSRPVTSNVTYTAQWRQFVTISFDMGQYSDLLYPIDSVQISYGSKYPLLPIPGWKNNSAVMAFDGWYLNSDLTQPITSDYIFYEDTTLYAKWSPKEDGYYVYFMDFFREGQTPLVLMTYSVTENHTAASYTPGNEPEGAQWDGKWYLEKECVNPYNFLVPVSQMEGYLTGANGRDLYLYPGTQEVCRAIFVTYGTKVDPVTIPVGGSIDLDQYRPERAGFEFAGWTLQDGTPISGVQKVDETTTFYAKWDAGYVPFEAILRIENANDTDMTQADILGTWYAKSGSQIRVKSTYSGSGTSRKGTHQIVCVLNGVEYPVYNDASLSQRATLNDVYSTYFIYNNTGTNWTDEINWDDVYTGGEVPYSTRPISSVGDTIINFDYMRVRTDVRFVTSNRNAYLDIFKLYNNGLLTGSVTYTGTKPNSTGSNVSASGVSGSNTKWTYTAGSRNSGSNVYTLLDVKYGQRIYDDYPVGGSWLTVKSSKFYTWVCNGTNFTSRRQDLSDAFFKGSGRNATAYELNADFTDYDQTALMYALECLPGETADFTINNVGYKVQTHLSEVVNSSGNFSAKELLGCYDGKNAKGSGYYSNLSSSRDTVGGISVKTLFGTTYWEFYNKYTGIDSLSDIDRAYIFYYDRIDISINFSFGYDSNGDSANEKVVYEDIAFGEKIDEYQFGKPDFERHGLLDREGYEFAGWLDANGFVLEAEDWGSLVATGDSENNTMIFIAKWEKISNNIVEYYEDRSSAKPFESHYFDDGELVQYPTMTVYPEGWVWQEYGEGQFERFDWDVPMYGEYGVKELRVINGEQRAVNVIRIYGTWDESHTKVVYDANAAQGGIPATAPTDSNEYTIWQSEVSVKAQGDTANTDPNMIFTGWLLDRNGTVYQPGDHVPVRWPRTMIFTAQWAKPEEVVYLRYDPNGGTPNAPYPSESGFAYKKNATAVVWENLTQSENAWYVRSGYTFKGWNTQADGSGTSYAPNSTIVLTQAQTTLYAQWERDLHTLSLYKVESEEKRPLKGAVFGLYCYENGEFRLVETLTTGTDGHVSFPELHTELLYRLVEEKPPNGYATITKEMFFKLIPEENSISFAFCDAQGNVSEIPSGITAEYVTANKILSLTVENLRGYALPSTGGNGKLLYILCGLILLLGPFVYGFGLRRRYGRRSTH